MPAVRAAAMATVIQPNFHQPGQPPEDSRIARHGERVRTGACVVSVFTRSEEEKQYVEQLLLRSSARSTGVQP